MRVFATAFKLLLSAVVVSCICLSSYFAFEFGWARGTDLLSHWAFGFMGAGLDLCKSGILLFTQDHPRNERRAAVVGFWFLTALSLWCAYGNTATHLATKFTDKVVAATSVTLAQSRLDGLKADKAKLPHYVPTTEEALQAASEASATATEQREAECDKRGPNCRAREADERGAKAAATTAASNRAMTIAATALDAKIADAENVLAHTDQRKANESVNPQAEDMAKAIGISVGIAALIGHAFFALGVEVGSGLMPWLLWGHGSARRREEEPSGELVPPAPIPLRETPDSIRQRFFDEVVIPADGRVLGSKMYAAYVRWCADNGHEPMTPHAFGLDPPWEKEKKGGNVWYVSCSIAEAYNQPQLSLVAR
jgi:hypothetical protein